MFSAIKYIVIAVVLGGLAFAGWQVMNLKADLAIMEENNKKLVSAVAEQQAVMKQKEAEFAMILEKTKQLEEENRKREADVATLTSKFDKRDFGKLAEEKPAVVEKLINRGTKNALRCLEIASGSPLTPEELNAKDPKEANRECPALINPAYSPLS